VKTGRGGVRRSAALVALVLAVASMAACGRDDDSSGGGGGDGELATAPGFDGKTFTWGMLTVTSGPVAQGAVGSIAGTQTAVEALNARGGIAGKYPVKLVLRDTAYDPSKTVQAYNSTKADVSAYATVFGTPPIKALVPQLRTDRIISVPGSFDGTLLREQPILLTSSPYETHVVTGVEYLRSQPGGADKKVCGAGNEGAVAASVRRGLEHLRDEEGIDLGPIVEFPAAASNLTTQVQQLKRAGCEIVQIIANPVPGVSGAMSAAARLRFTPQWIGTSPNFIVQFKDSPVFDYLKEHYYIVSDTTPFGDTEHGGEDMRDFMAAHERFGKEQPQWSYSNGWNSIRALEQVFEKAVEDGDVSRDGIMKALDSLTRIDYGGLEFPWTWGPPAERRPPDRYLILRPDDEAITGLRVAEFDLQTPQAAIDFPFENEG
jgi:ABC-type branched-subunit amino acid transport system substrate-binding protein